VALAKGTKLRRKATANRLAARPHAARSAYNYFVAEQKANATITSDKWHKEALVAWKKLGEQAKGAKSRACFSKWDSLAREDKLRFAQELESGTAQGPKTKGRGRSSGKGKARSTSKGKAGPDHEDTDEDDEDMDDAGDGETNQPLMESGQRIEVQFDDDDVGGKSWFNGVVEEQTATGTVITFDDGDVEDLNPNTIRFFLVDH
jgi:hypothetical protein